MGSPVTADLSEEAYEKEKKRLEEAQAGAADSKSEAERYSKELLRLNRQWAEQKRREEAVAAAKLDKAARDGAAKKEELRSKKKVLEAKLGVAERAGREEEVGKLKGHIAEVNALIGEDKGTSRAG